MAGPMSISAAALLLADARFPSGSHAHSGGLEAAVGAGRVTDLAGLAVFLEGRLRTAGLVEASLAAAVVARGGGAPWTELDREAVARTASPALRATSRRLGRQLVRAAGIVWPHPVLGRVTASSPPEGPLSAIALGAVGIAAGLRAHDVALVGAHQCVAGPAAAAVRLLGLDPVAVQALVARLDLEGTAATAVAAAARPLAELPGPSATLLELEAEVHARQEVRLFAS